MVKPLNFSFRFLNFRSDDRLTWESYSKGGIIPYGGIGDGRERAMGYVPYPASGYALSNGSRRDDRNYISTHSPYVVDMNGSDRPYGMSHLSVYISTCSTVTYIYDI